MLYNNQWRNTVALSDSKINWDANLSEPFTGGTLARIQRHSLTGQT